MKELWCSESCRIVSVSPAPPKQHLLVGDQAAQPHRVDRHAVDVGAAGAVAGRASVGVRLRGQPGRARGRRRSAGRCGWPCRSARRPCPGGAARRSRPTRRTRAACCGEPHHQHRADGEVRARSARRSPGAAASQPLSIGQPLLGPKPVVPTTAWIPWARQNSRLPITASGWVKSTATWAPASTSELQRQSPRRPRPPVPGPSAASTAAHTSGPSGPARAEHGDPQTCHRTVLDSRDSGRSGDGSAAAASAADGPITASEGRSAQHVAGTSRTSSRVTAVDPAEHLVDRQMLRRRTSSALADPAHPRAGVLQAEHRGAARSGRSARSAPPRPMPCCGDRSSSPRQSASTSLDLAWAGSPRRRRTARCRRTAVENE